MNKNLICFGSGLAIGIGSAYLYLRDYYNKLIDSETEKVRLYYENLDHEPIEKVCEDIEQEFEGWPESSKSGKNEAKKGIVAPVTPDYAEIVEKLNYNQYSTKPKSDNVVENNSENEPNGPYPISYDVYAETASKYTTRQVSYFLEDDVLLYIDTDEVMDDPGRLIGNDNLADLRNNDELDEMYVRNEYMGIDYYIIKEEGSYEEYLAE